MNTKMNIPVWVSSRLLQNHVTLATSSTYREDFKQYLHKYLASKEQKTAIIKILNKKKSTGSQRENSLRKDCTHYPWKRKIHLLHQGHDCNSVTNRRSHKDPAKTKTLFQQKIQPTEITSCPQKLQENLSSRPNRTVVSFSHHSNHIIPATLPLVFLSVFDTDT